MQAKHWNMVEILPCIVKLALRGALHSRSSLLAFYLYVCNYNFRYLLPGYFQTWFCLYIFPSWELFPDCLFSGRMILSVVGNITLGCGVVWPYRDTAWPEIWESPLVPSYPSCPPALNVIAHQVALILASRCFLNLHPPLHPLYPPPLFWSSFACPTQQLPDWLLCLQPDCFDTLCISSSPPYLIPSTSLPSYRINCALYWDI